MHRKNEDEKKILLKNKERELLKSRLISNIDAAMGYYLIDEKSTLGEGLLEAINFIKEA